MNSTRIPEIFHGFNQNRAQRTAGGASRDNVLGLIRDLIAQSNFHEALDLLEDLANREFPNNMESLACANEIYTIMNKEDRYSLYQSRHFDFGIKPGDSVLDIGSGHLPFPLATTLAEFATEDNFYGRAGVPVANPHGKPLYQCSVEKMPFKDKEFDFVYCSHVLEHVQDPIQACRELMRVARRGYIETPTPGKDLWLDTARASNHLWAVEYTGNRLRFRRYTQKEIEGLRFGLLMEMHCAPQTVKEKAFSALILLKAPLFNTMVLWNDKFSYEVVE